MKLNRVLRLTAGCLLAVSLGLFGLPGARWRAFSTCPGLWISSPFLSTPLPDLPLEQTNRYSKSA